jgi:hypothetical protein
MLSSIPKLADRAFVLGAFLPSLLFEVSVLLLFYDTGPARAWINELPKKDLGQAAYLLLAVWVVAVLVLMLNYPLYRLLEGYTFPEAVAQRLIIRNQKRLQKTKRQIDELNRQWSEQGDNFSKEKIREHTTLSWSLAARFPSREEDVLPTRFGNAIRSFEVYPWDIYGVDAIAIWPRLAAVVPRAFADEVQGTRSQVDFLVNCFFFSVIIALLGIARVVYYLAHFYPANSDIVTRLDAPGCFGIIGGLVFAGIFYHWAVSRVPAWGSLVMSAFDCYLPALARQLGFELPSTNKKRREFWTELSRQSLYRREPDGRPPFRPEKWKQLVRTTSAKPPDDEKTGKADETSDEDKS